MKSTGVIRRIDELGRIVIPKEIRKNLKIRDGENMEIFVEVDSIVLKKYSRIEDSIPLAKRISGLLDNLTNNFIIITDREQIISASGEQRGEFESVPINKELISFIDNRESFFSEKESTISISDDKALTGYFAITPIVTSADSIGLVLIYNTENNVTENKVLAKFIASLISANVDIS